MVRPSGGDIGRGIPLLQDSAPKDRKEYGFLGSGFRMVSASILKAGVAVLRLILIILIDYRAVLDDRLTFKDKTSGQPQVYYSHLFSE